MTESALFFLLYRKFLRNSLYNKDTACRRCALARKEYVAKATALGARVSHAKLFVQKTNNEDFKERKEEII